MPLGELDQCGGERGFVPAGVVQLHFNRESVAEDVAPPTERALRPSVITIAETGCDRPGRRTGQHLQSFASLRYLLPGDARASARFFSISLLPRRELANARSGDERSQIVEPLFAPSQKAGRTSIDYELGANDRPYILPSCLESKANYPTQIGRVGDSNGAVAE
jgi:hypothetical protein